MSDQRAQTLLPGGWWALPFASRPGRALNSVLFLVLRWESGIALRAVWSGKGGLARPGWYLRYLTRPCLTSQVPTVGPDVGVWVVT
jgi:hypothetical protein